MKKALKILLLTALMIILGVGAFIFTSCDDLPEDILPHEHLWGDWEIVKEATCTEKGEIKLTCSACGETKTMPYDKKGHESNDNCEIIDAAIPPTCTEDGITEGSHCSICHEVIIAQKIVPALGHNYVLGNCERCRLTSPECFEFTLLDDGTYSIKAKNADKMPRNVTIPADYNGKSVSVIDERGFFDCDNIVNVVIPNSVVRLDNWAFGGCDNLKSVHIGKGVRDIGWYCFAGPNKLTNISVDVNNANYKSIDGNLYTSNEQHLVQYAAGKTDTIFVIPNGISAIYPTAFYGAEHLTRIVIPTDMSKIHEYAFSHCTSLTHVLYSDTETEWNYIWIDTTNNELFNATLYFYSETKPTEEGNFWCWVDGAPAVWGVDHVHTVVIDEAISPTCTETGLTAGKHCSTCGKVFVAQQDVPATGHSISDWIITKEPTCTEDGKKQISCTICGVICQEEILKTGHLYTDGKCITCGNEINIEGEKIVFDFGEKGEEKHVDPHSFDKDTVFESDNYTLKFTDIYKIFGIAYDAKGNSCIKIGIREEIGSLTFEVPTDVTAVIIRIAKYKANDSEVVINGIPYSPTKNSNDGEYNELIIDTSETKTVTITTIAKKYRVMIDSITYVIGSDSSECDHEIEIIPEVSATCTSAGLTEGKKCSICGEILVAQETVPAIGHNYIDGNCEVCGAIQYSEGLEFTSNGDGTCYVSGIGTCTDTNIMIPEVSPMGDTVTKVEDGAFYNCTTITEVVIPDSVTSIGYDAFFSCSRLTNITIGSGVNNISQSALDYCGSIVNITVDENNLYYESIDGNLYNENVTNLIQYARGKKNASFEIPDSVISIDYRAASGSVNLTKVVVGNSVTTIGDSAFYALHNLAELVIPKSVTTIDDWAFLDCSKLNKVYYTGTETDWVNISISSNGNNYLKNATRYYYSETQPTTEGNFWHWVDGEVVVWE